MSGDGGPARQNPDLGEVSEAAARLDPHAILESIPEPVGLVDRQGRLLGFNAPGRTVILAVRGQEVALGADLFSFISDHNIPGVKASLARAFEGEAHTHRTTAADRHFETVYSPVRGPDGDVAFVSIRVADVTQREQALADLAALNATLEERVEQRGKELRVILSSTHDGFALFELGGRFVEVNDAYCRLVGYSRDELLEMNVRDVDVGLTPARLAETGRKLRETGSASFETRHRRKDGRIVDVDATVNWENLTGGRYITFMRDITARKEAEADGEERTAELARLNADLARAARAKDEFLASMSHELRTPLTGILGAAELLRVGVHGELNERQTRTLGILENAGRHLLSLLSDILDVARIGAGRLTLEPDACSLEEICELALSLVRAEARRKRIKLAFQCPPAPVRFAADPRRLHQVLVNLLSNAVKFTPEEGRVELVASADSVEAVVRLEILDTGPGIAREDLPNLFRPFTQLDARLAREHGGSGLGLSLARGMAELHGGRIEVESEPGRGSRFSVVLPWRTPERRAPRPKETAPRDPEASLPARGRILLVEDDADNRTLLAEFLEAQGYALDTASTGREALEIAMRSRHDLVILDIQLPGMDGLEVLRELRARRSAHVPVLALTALAMVGDRDRILEAGADAYLSKPVAFVALRAEIDRLLEGAPNRDGSSEAAE